MQLTPLDRDLLACFRAGLTPRQIAAARKIATTAVLDDIARLYRKLDATDRPSALAAAARIADAGACAACGATFPCGARFCDVCGAAVRS